MGYMFGAFNANTIPNMEPEENSVNQSAIESLNLTEAEKTELTSES